MQFLGEDVDDARESVECSLSVQEGETTPASKNVDGGLGVFVASGIANFSFDVYGDSKISNGNNKPEKVERTGIPRGEFDTVKRP